MSQIKSGAALSIAATMINIVLSLIYVPLLVHYLGSENYGVYELIGSFIGYLNIMDMGLSTTLSRFLVKAKSQGKLSEVSSLLLMSLLVYLLLTACAVVLCFVLNGSLEEMFSEGLNAEEMVLAHNMMIVVTINCIIVLPSNWFLAILVAHERFVYTRLLQIGRHVLQFAGVLAVLLLGSGAVAVLGVQVFVNAVLAGCYVAFCLRKRLIELKEPRWNGGLFRQMLSFSFFILLNIVFDQLFWKTGQIVLGMTAGAIAVAIYSVVCNIAMAYMQVSASISGVFLPRITAISARTDEMDQIDDLFCSVGRIQSYLVLGICSAFIVLGQHFIFLWVGEAFMPAYICIVVIMLSLVIALTQNLGLTILQAKGKIAFRACVYVAAALLATVVSYFASMRFGVYGCAIVSALALFLLTGPIMNIYYYRVIGLDLMRFWKGIIPVLLLNIAFVLVCYFPSNMLPATWPLFIGEAIIYVLIYASIAWFFVMNDFEKNLISSFFRRFQCLKSHD